jgi:hypothetical protein
VVLTRLGRKNQKLDTMSNLIFFVTLKLRTAKDLLEDLTLTFTQIRSKELSISSQLDPVGV